MQVAIRVDAAAWIGIGHLKRCMALAEALSAAGASVCLVCRQLDKVARTVLENSRLSTIWLEPVHSTSAISAESPALPPLHEWARVDWRTDAHETARAVALEMKADWLVVDHYAFDARWHQEIRQGLGCRLAVIDDVADRALDADLLIDHNLADDHRAKYKGLISADTPLLGGPRYALLDAIYARSPKYEFRTEVRSIGVFMGGTDPGGVSARIVEACRREAGFSGLVEVVSSSGNPHLDNLQSSCKAWPKTMLTIDLPHLANFFSTHDIQIGAGGGAAWERCCIGAPSIVVPIADNQRPGVALLAQSEIVRSASMEPRSSSSGQPETSVASVVRELIAKPDARRRLVERAASLVDGLGAQRVALWMRRDAIRLRPAMATDAPLLHRWRNHPTVRAVSTDPQEIAYSDHEKWLQTVLMDNDRVLLVAQVQETLIGCIRFDRAGEGDEVVRLEVSLYLDPDFPGLGLGPRLLLAGEKWMLHCSGIPLLVEANVVPDNLASQRLFERCGYKGGPHFYEKCLEAPPTRLQEQTP